MNRDAQIGHNSDDRVVIRRRGAAAGPVTVTPDQPTYRTPPEEARRARRSHDDQPRETDIEIPEGTNWTRDRVRWGPILAGAVTAITTLLLLGLLGIAVGYTPSTAWWLAAQGAPPAEVVRNATVWAALAGIIAFLLGGFVAGKTAAVFDREWGALNGVLVFLVTVPLALWLAGQGLGALMGTVGALGGVLNPDPYGFPLTPDAVNAIRDLSPEEAARAADDARKAAGGALMGAVLSLGAAALGGFLGTRRELTIDWRTGQIHD